MKHSDRTPTHLLAMNSILIDKECESNCIVDRITLENIMTEICIYNILDM